MAHNKAGDTLRPAARLILAAMPRAKLNMMIVASENITMTLMVWRVRPSMRKSFHTTAHTAAQNSFMLFKTCPTQQMRVNPRGNLLPPIF